MTHAGDLEITEVSVGLLSDEKITRSAASRWHRLPNCLATCSTGKMVLVDALKCTCLFLLPSFIASRTRTTVYLDGLRGLAAYFVVNSPLSLALTRTAGIGFGHSGSTNEIQRLLMFRLIYHGAAAVSILFVISEYALSIGPVIVMKKSPKDSEVFMKKLASSVIRRPFRLYLPFFASVLLIFCYPL